MPHVETFDPELERAHRRMDDIERKVQQLRQNAAPTVPQYDLQATVTIPTNINVLKATSSTGATWSQFAGGGIGNTYAQVDVMIPSSTLTLLASQSVSADLMLVGDFDDAIYLSRSGSDWMLTTYHTTSAVVLIPDIWHKLGLLRTPVGSSTLSWYWNDVNIITDTGVPNSFGQGNHINIGASEPSIDNEVYYYDNFGVGSDFGLRDLNCQPFDSTDMSIYGSLPKGDVIVLVDPLGTGGPNPC